MINNVKFIERLKKVMEYHQLSASTFADKVGVQRSSISHILSGRNKPSLDFILKVTSAFSEIDIHWLLNGKGEYPKISDSNTTASSLFVDSNTVSGKRIQRIVVFYNDGTFDEYKK